MMIIIIIDFRWMKFNRNETKRKKIISCFHFKKVFFSFIQIEIGCCCSCVNSHWVSKNLNLKTSFFFVRQKAIFLSSSWKKSFLNGWMNIHHHHNHRFIANLNFEKNYFHTSFFFSDKMGDRPLEIVFLGRKWINIYFKTFKRLHVFIIIIH